MNDKPIKVGDRVRHFSFGAGDVKGIDGKFLWIEQVGHYGTWHISDCTRIPRTRKVERWVVAYRSCGHMLYCVCESDHDALNICGRISAPVCVELEVEEES